MEDLSLSEIILDPDGPITYYWLGIVTLAVVYNIAVIILRLAFQEMRDTVIEDSVFYLLDTIGDLIYIVDIIVHLRISYYEDGCLVLDPVKIMIRYQKSYTFKVALLAIFPFGTVYALISGIGCIFVHPSFYISGDIHIMLVRLPRLLKYPTMAMFFNLTDSRTRNPNLIRAFKLMLNLWMVIHWIGCVYYVMSEYEGLGSNNWVYPIDTGNSTFSRKYIRVTYWSLMTLTTIGERPPPETDLEFVFTGLTFLIGVFVFAAVVGNVGDVISNMNAARTEFQSRMDQIKAYLQHRHVDERLQNRVKRWAEYTWKRTQLITEPSLLQLLPERLRTEIAINVHLETLKKVKLFEECEEGLLRELVLKLRPQVYSPGDFICRTGEIGKEMFIVNHGKVEILVPGEDVGQRTIVATLSPGNYFGEISLLKIDDGQNRRTADVKAVGYSELLRLSRKDLMSALVEYPNAKRILEQQAKERIEKTKEMRASRRASTADDSVIQLADTYRDECPPRRKRDLLLKVVKSDNFRKLLSTRYSEMNELKEIVAELKGLQSQTNKDLVLSLQQEKNELQIELKKRNTDVSVLKRKIYRHLLKEKSCTCERLQTTPTCSRTQMNVHGAELQMTHTCDPTQTSQTTNTNIARNGANALSTGEHVATSEYNGDTSVGEKSFCFAQDTSSKLGLALRNPVPSTKHRLRKHLSNCSLVSLADQSTCRSLRYSISSPNVIKVDKIKKPNNPEKLPSTSSSDVTFIYAATNQNTDGAIKIKSDNHEDCSYNRQNSRINHEEEHEYGSNQELQAIEGLLELESSYLTDSSLQSTDHSSDEHSDMDFEIPE